MRRHLDLVVPLVHARVGALARVGGDPLAAPGLAILWLRRVFPALAKSPKSGAFPNPGPASCPGVETFVSRSFDFPGAAPAAFVTSVANKEISGQPNEMIFPALRFRQTTRTHALILALAVFAIGYPLVERPCSAQADLERKTYDPARIKASLERHVRERAEEEIGKLNPQRDSLKSAVLERNRDEQTQDINHTLEDIGEAFAKNEVDVNFSAAIQLLADKGVRETLRFLDDTKNQRETELEALKNIENLPAASRESTAAREIPRGIAVGEGSPVCTSRG